MFIPAFLGLYLAATCASYWHVLPLTAVSVCQVCELKEIFLELYTPVYLHLNSRVPKFSLQVLNLHHS